MICACCIIMYNVLHMIHMETYTERERESKERDGEKER